MVKFKNEETELHIQNIIVFILAAIALLSPWAVVLWYIYQL